MRWNFAKRRSVSHRIILSFMLAAALPLFMLGASAYYLAYSRLEQVALDDARGLAKSLGMDVFERLQLLTDQLLLVAENGATGRALHTRFEDLDLGERVRGFFTIDGQRRIAGITALTAAERTVLQGSLDSVVADSPVLLAVGPGGRQRLFMMVNDGDGYFGAELSLRHLWDTAGVAARPERVCVLDADAVPVFCNHTDYRGWLAASASLMTVNARPGSVRHDNGETMLTASWSLFLKPYYQFERWTILVGVPESLAFASIARFDRVFYGGAVVALLIALAFGRRLIRSNLEPLDRLSAATHHLAAGEFDYRVQLGTGDEFEQLGDAFDGMAARIGQQFRQLDASARLDRELHSATSIESALLSALVALEELLGRGRCALLCQERWHDPGEVYCIGFGAQSVEHCEASDIHEEIHELAVQRGLVPLGYGVGTKQAADEPVLVPVTDGDVVAAVISVRYGRDGDVDTVRRVADVLGIALGNLAMERRLYYQANHDWLSGLPNRSRLHDQFVEWSLSSAGTRAIGMVLIGLDRFKQVNDSVGHTMGDHLLSVVGQRLRAALPDDVVLGRFSGDQFLLMLVDESHAQLLLRLEEQAQCMSRELDREFALGARQVRLSASMGAALHPRDALSFEGMLQCLDAASYAAKASRRGGLLFFSSGMRDRLVGRMDVEQALKGAVANNEMVLHYQPVVDAISGRVRGAEALIRWQRPGVGLVFPGDFIEIAEESGLINEIGRWALGAVCRQMVAWIDAGVHLDTLNVNVSSLQTADDTFEDSVAQALQESGLEPSRLTLEVTETALIGRFDEGVERLKRVRQLGARIMIDDFGTGYASLKYLKMLPIDGLKIDRLFVKDLPDSPADDAIVTAVVSLSRASSFKLVAEGIETRSQAELLRDRGVPYLQGYLFAKALPPEQFVDLVRAMDDAPAPTAAVGSA
ncbi:MAG: EAL domain-containing protein [Gammaproteobacteria bacterium]|nr:EAL domain-containing protein [Gammaproteobacteria bacterium]